MTSVKRKHVDISDDDVASFIAITGASDSIARKRLQITNGDLMMAINQHMDSNGVLNEDTGDDDVEVVEVGSSNRSSVKRNRHGEGSSTHPRRRTSATSNGGAVADGPSCSTTDDDVRAPIAPFTARLLDPHHDMDWGDTMPRTNSAFDGLRDFSVEADRQEEMLACPERAKKRRTLEDLFRPPIHLMFHGTFLAARDEATARKKWLMVNIQNMKEFCCQVLNRDIWSDSVVEAIVKEQFVFWQVYSDSGEGKRFMRFYNVNSWPYVAILDPRTGECMVEYSHIARDTFCDNILTFLNGTQWEAQHTPREASVASVSSTQDSSSSSKSKSDVASSIIDASEEQQLEMALAASLREAACSSAVATAALSKTPSASASAASPEASPAPAPMDSPAPAPASASASASGSDIDSGDELPVASPGSSPFRPTEPAVQQGSAASKICIMLRYPDGRREEASFPSTAPLVVLEQHVASRGFPTAQYELVTHFPRRNLSNLKGVTLEGADLDPRDTVFVQLKA